MARAVAQPSLAAARLREIAGVLAPDPDTERRMRAHHVCVAKAVDVQTEPSGEFYGW
ncbi:MULTISPECIES: hypothetical protein [unclassified Streptomyces]|uniref:hypothetical protein n=1 Tax=unclassified Streptomyces TaxID=2593676 RepID=UPI0036EBAEAD